MVAQHDGQSMATGNEVPERLPDLSRALENRQQLVRGLPIVDGERKEAPASLLGEEIDDVPGNDQAGVQLDVVWSCRPLDEPNEMRPPCIGAHLERGLVTGR